MSSEPQEGSVSEQLSAAEGTMSSFQSLRESICERLAAAAEEIFRLCEGTIVQYEQELCRQRGLLDSSWKPQLQLHHIDLPQQWMTEEKDLCNQQRNFRVEQEEPEPPQIKEEQEEPEPPQIQEEPGELCISHVSAVLPQHWVTEEEDPCNQQRNFRAEQEEPEPLQTEERLQEPEPPQIKEEPGELFNNRDEDQLDLKQETDTLMEIPTYEEDENSEADPNNQQSFNVTDSQDEKGNQHVESTSTTDVETDQQNRDQRKGRDRSHVQSVDNFHRSESDPVGGKNRHTSLVKKHKQCPKGKRSSYIKFGKRKGIANNVSMRTESERPYVCQECGKSFDYLSQVRIHMRTHTGEKPFSCKGCNKSFSRISSLKRHMRNYTGEKPFLCKECHKSFSEISFLQSHMRTHTKEKPFTCKECFKRFSLLSNLKRHMRTHTDENPFCCEECDKSFSRKFHLKTHMKTHTGEKAFSTTKSEISQI